MTPTNTPSGRPAAALLVAGLMACTGIAQAAGSPARPVDAARMQYEREKADCLTGKNSQPRNVCLREAGAAYAQARRGRLAPPNDGAEQWAANAVMRCQAQPPEDRELCERRVREGQVEGSVGGGGQIRSLTVRSPEVPTPPR